MIESKGEALPVGAAGDGSRASSGSSGPGGRAEVLRGLLSGLKGVLRYHQALGIDHYPGSSALAAFLRLRLQDKEEAAQPTAPTSSAVLPSGHPADVANVPAAALDLTAIAREVACCRACSLAGKRLYPVPGRGAGKARLLLVGDHLAAEAGGVLPPGQLFGVRQDDMLLKMLAAIQLDPAEVYITNLIKCALPAGCLPQAAHQASCLPFLRQEIATIAPQVICSMGMAATRALLAGTGSLSSLRGTFHPLPGTSEAGPVVLATYHPSYLLQNPEMKRATWADLQLLARRLSQG